MSTDTQLAMFQEFRDTLRKFYLEINKVTTDNDNSKYRSFYIQLMRDLEYNLGNMTLNCDKIINNFDSRFNEVKPAVPPQQQGIPPIVGGKPAEVVLPSKPEEEATAPSN